MNPRHPAPPHDAEKQVEPAASRPQQTAEPSRRLVLLAAVGAVAGPTLGLAGCGGGDPENLTSPAGDADALRRPLGVDSGGTGGRRRLYFAAVVRQTQPLVAGGTSFVTSNTQVLDAAGQSVSLADVLPGMTAQIEASRQAPSRRGEPALVTAQTIRTSAELLGPADADIDASTGTFSLLGQRVATTAETVLDPALGPGLDALTAGQFLRVHGLQDKAGGRVVATRIDLLENPPSQLEVRGTLTAFDAALGTAAIGALALVVRPDAGAAVRTDLAVGTMVRATLWSQGPGQPGQLLSLAASELAVPDQVEAELEGSITRVDSAERFEVDGVPVRANAASWGRTPPSLRPGLTVAVHGLMVGGVLQASSVRAEADEPVELEGGITAIDLAVQQFELKGVTVAWFSSTRFEGGGVSLLTVHRRAAVVGQWAADGKTLRADHIHLEA